MAIFLCNNRTMAGCFEHQLFGTGDGYGLQVRQGDFCLLYNFEQNQVFGVWRATSDGGNYEPHAWHGQFPNQVRIEEAGEIKQATRNQIQALVGSQIIGKIYVGELAESLLQHFQPEVRGQTARTGQTATASRPTESRAPRQTTPDYLLLPPKFFCEDTHRVRSQGEKIIDDCLFRLGVRHDYEPQITIQGGQMIPDFVVYARDGKPVYIEYWGKLNERDYDARRIEKTLLYRSNNLPLIQIIPDDLQKIKFVLEKELENWDVPFKDSFFSLLGYFFKRLFNMLRSR
ncbi:MAG: hypothetical protein PHY43_02005 [Verrucomicrobiales bacterium]|nr:hypothetical protein [Verrucomicrobiales bacterium]